LTGWTGYDCSTPICVQAEKLVFNVNSSKYARNFVQLRQEAKDFHVLRGRQFGKEEDKKLCEKAHRCPQFDEELVSNDGQSFQFGCENVKPILQSATVKKTSSDKNKLENLRNYMDLLNGNKEIILIKVDAKFVLTIGIIRNYKMIHGRWKHGVYQEKESMSVFIKVLVLHQILVVVVMGMKESTVENHSVVFYKQMEVSILDVKMMGSVSTRTFVNVFKFHPLYLQNTVQVHQKGQQAFLVPIVVYLFVCKVFLIHYVIQMTLEIWMVAIDVQIVVNVLHQMFVNVLLDGQDLIAKHLFVKFQRKT
jgi:hypothetical protein